MVEVWYKLVYTHSVRAWWCGLIIKPPMFGWDGWGLNTVSLFQMENNVIN